MRKRILILSVYIPVMVLVATLLTSCAHEKTMLAIVQDGKPLARIVLGDDAVPVAEFAAKELQTYIQKSTGATIPIVKALSDDGAVEIVIGDSKVSQSLGVHAKGLGRDSFYIKTIGKRIIILGKDHPTETIENRFLINVGRNPNGYEHATLFGVYEFLERFLGVRWYLPGDIGEVVPKTETLSIPIVNIVERPNKIGRFVHVGYGADDRDDPPPTSKSGGYRPALEGEEKAAFHKRRGLWFLRMRNQTQLMSGAPHTMPILISKKQYGKSNPEFFATGKDGKRNFGHHCYTNPGTIKTLIRQAEGCFAGKPASDFGLTDWGSMSIDCGLGKAFHITPSDGYVPCLCERCKAFRASCGPEVVNIEEELVWTTIIKVANSVGKTFPDCYISVSGYGPLGAPPIQKIPLNIFVGPTAVTGPYSEFRADMMKEELRVLNWWGDALAPQQSGGFYHYAVRACYENGRYFWHKSICGSIPRAIASCYKRYADRGIGTYFYLLSHRMAYDHLNVYVFYKYHWNPNRDIDALLDEYYTLFYGSASAPMEKFFEEVETKFREVLQLDKSTSGTHPSVDNPADIWEKVYTRKVIIRWQGYFAEAARLAEKDKNPLYAKRVAYMKRNILDTIEEGLVEHEKP
jgi:Domain of unknown function (DUF4838)